MPHPAARRASWIAAFLAAPAVTCAVALTAMEGYRVMQPEAAIFGGPRPATLSQSIFDGFGVEETYQFIRAGQDPNGVLAVAHPDYTDGTTVRASPLLVAVAAEDSSAVRMLFAFGARLDLPQNRLVECLARELVHPEIETILADERGTAPAPPCTDRKPDAPTPLVAWAE
jgi:hypothetical protein